MRPSRELCAWRGGQGSGLVHAHQPSPAPITGDELKAWGMPLLQRRSVLRKLAQLLERERGAGGR